MLNKLGFYCGYKIISIKNIIAFLTPPNSAYIYIFTYYINKHVCDATTVDKGQKLNLNKTY